MHPVALVLCTLIASGAVVAVAWLLRAPIVAEARMAELVEAARLKLELEFAKAVESLELIGEKVRRHRAAIDGGKRGDPARGDDPAPQRELWQLSAQEAARLSVKEQLDWHRERRRRGAMQ